MKKIIILFLALTLIQGKVIAQTKNDSFRLYYGFAGLGSNMGSMQPNIKIIGANLIYTFEQNSYYDKKTLPPDTICIVTVRQSSIDSILNIIEGLKDTTIYETNVCIMSGGIHYMTIVLNQDTTHFTLHNTFHRTALKISEIINLYLPKEKNIWATEQDIIDCENCWKTLREK